MGLGVKLIISAATAALLLILVDVRGAVSALAGLAPGGVAVAGLLFFSTHLANAAKLHVVLPERRVRALLAYTLLAQAYALLLPGQIAGEAMKAYRLGRGQGAEAGRIVSSVAFDKATAIGAVLVLTLAGGLFQPGLLAGGAGWAAAAVLFALTGAGAVLAWDGGRRRIAAALPGMARLGRIGPPLRHFLDAWSGHARQPRTLVLSLAWGILAQILTVAGTQVLGGGLGIVLPFPAWIVVIGMLTVVLLMPLTIGGLGVREASLVGFLSLLGVAEERALALALALLAFQLATAVVGLATDLLVLRRR